MQSVGACGSFPAAAIGSGIAMLVASVEEAVFLWVMMHWLVCCPSHHGGVTRELLLLLLVLLLLEIPPTA